MGALDYTTYASQGHPPYSNGPLKFPYQRPPPDKRTYHVPEVEEVIEQMNQRLKDKDLARMFENCYPNTVDTTAKWVHTGRQAGDSGADGDGLPGAHIIAGDMDAAWLRDNVWQLQPYTPLLATSPALRALWLGVLHTQSRNLIRHPYTNAFQPPPESGLAPVAEHVVDTAKDRVVPPFDPRVSFEAKYSLDSLAALLRLARVYDEQTWTDGGTGGNRGGFDAVAPAVVAAAHAILRVVEAQSLPTFDEGRSDTGLTPVQYSFQRATLAPSITTKSNPYHGSDTIANAGVGNPVRGGTGLVRSAFRASDDACILPFWIPGNAFLAVELMGAAAYLQRYDPAVAAAAARRGQQIRDGIYQHGVFTHSQFGKIFAYEVDGYGSRIVMDDASPPSLLALPYLGFCARDDPVYRNTRAMVLSRAGNPYYVVGTVLHGQGSPHIDLATMWPVGTALRLLTSDDDAEILAELEQAKRASGGLGLMHEGVDVNDPKNFVRTWYAWGNSAFGDAIVDLAQRKPHLLF
ncbi:Six-hairpin glycosidase [Niveomyces insectorum RCEF 264]|uniref:Six-hairpin glycosidase n=1 Tax=Niveomyces insectorum RCEF 264 TaxID=1081102 RepID=A0A167MN75_9HYPO|nr:Six-hairpin glycosidase [Niveomyces insectorum RCEF 264]